jgi:hypothetical protein
MPASQSFGQIDELAFGILTKITFVHVLSRDATFLFDCERTSR